MFLWTLRASFITLFITVKIKLCSNDQLLRIIKNCDLKFISYINGLFLYENK